MRILLVNKFHYRKGGAATCYLTVGSELERMGHEVSYFSMRHLENLPCRWDCNQSKFMNELIELYEREIDAKR